MIYWFEGQIDVLATLMREGKTAGQISKIFGVSRGAVVGVVYRTEKLKEIGFRTPAPIKKLPDGTARRTTERDHIDARLKRQHMGLPIIGLATVRKERTLMELTSSQCRFPIWGHSERPTEYLFCAEPRADDSSYCTAHHRLCLAQPRTNRSTP